MIHKIAIFRALYLGDMLLAVPALRALRQHFPLAEITLIGLPWAAAFVERYTGYLDRLVEFVGYPGLPEVEVRPQHTQAFIKDQRAYHYDLAIQMHGNGRTSNAFISELRAGMTVGYFPAGDDKASAAVTMSAPYPTEGHEIECNLGLAALSGCTSLDPRLEFPLWAEDFREIRWVLETLSLRATPWIGLHVGAKHSARRWPPAYFAELADMLARTLHASIILTGGAHEMSTVRKVISHMSTEPINLVGQTSLGGLAALLSTLDLFVSNDTGPAHLAYALDTPSVTLFGPTDYRRWQPLAQQRHRVLRVPVACSPCEYQVCPIDHRCLRQITPSFVQQVATTCLETIPALQRGRGKRRLLLQKS